MSKKLPIFVKKWAGILNLILFLNHTNFEDLDGDDVMILDALNTIYVWIGNGANNEERDSAQNTAKVNREN